MKKIDNIIPIKYFYDQTGSQLYDEIMRVPDYYLFQSEKGILCKYASKICESIEPDSIILEIGYSNSEKILPFSKEGSLTKHSFHFIGNDISISSFVEDIFKNPRSIRDQYPTQNIVLCWFGSSISNFPLIYEMSFLLIFV